MCTPEKSGAPQQGLIQDLNLGGCTNRRTFPGSGTQTVIRDMQLGVWGHT